MNTTHPTPHPPLQRLRNSPPRLHPESSCLEEVLPRAIALLKSNQFSPALEQLSALIRAQPQHTTAHYLAGLSHYQLDQTAAAIDCLQTHLALVPHDSRAWTVLASICFDQAQYLAAKHAYSQALLYQHQDVELLTQLGKTLQKLEDWQAALEVYSTLLKLNPESVLAHHQTALIHQALTQTEAALLHFQLAIALDDNSVELHFDLGLLWTAQEYFQLAYLQFKRCLMIEPRHYQSHYNCGLIKHKQQLWSEAIEHFEQAESLHEPYLQCWIAKGQTLMEQKLWPAAQGLFERVIELQADHLDAWLNLGLAFKVQKQFDWAQQCFVHILELEPNHVLALNNLGLLCQVLGHYELAVDCFAQCQHLDPHYLAACVNLAASEEKMGHDAKAMAGLQQGLDGVCLRSPVAVETMTRLSQQVGALPSQLLKGLPIEWAIGQRNLGLMYLRQGDFARGWPLYDYRFLCGEAKAQGSHCTKPWFDGLSAWGTCANAHGAVSSSAQTLLIWAEQGVGDEIMFGSLLSEAKPWAQALVVQVDARLLGLFKRAYPGLSFVARSAQLDDAQFDAHIPMGSLPRVLRPDRASFQAQPAAYLKADPELLLSVQREISAGAGSQAALPLRRIGISWRSHNDVFGRQRSMTLTRLVRQLQSQYTEGFRVISLQYGDVQDDIDECWRQTGVQVEQLASVDNFQDLEGLACLIQACDEVVSVDNSTVHLAGALGQAVTVLLPLSADWRWFEHTSQSLWYPSVRLRRQTAWGDWDSCWSSSL